MDNQTLDSAKEVAERIKAFAARELRKEFPNLEQNILERIATDSATTICQEVTKQHSAIEAIKARKNLLDLPPEIRNRIWEQVLIPEKEHPRVVHLRYHRPGGEDSIRLRHFVGEDDCHRPRIFIGPDREDDICRVSRQLRNETLPMYYANTTFILHLGVDGFDYARVRVLSLARWLGAIGQHNVKLIKRVLVVIASPAGRAPSYDTEHVLQSLQGRLYGLSDKMVYIRAAKQLSRY